MSNDSMPNDQRPSSRRHAPRRNFQRAPRARPWSAQNVESGDWVHMPTSDALETPALPEGFRQRLRARLMPTIAHLRSLLNGAANIVAPQPTNAALGDDLLRLPTTSGFGLGAILNALDWDHVREEVDRESRARIALMGATAAGKTTLLQHLKGFAVESPAPSAALTGEPHDQPRVEDWGLFAVVDVPAGSPNGRMDDGAAPWLAWQNADLIVWMLDGAAGLRAWEYEWICRVRATGKPLLVVLNKLDQVADAQTIEQLSHTLACHVIPIAAHDGTNVLSELLPHLLDSSPQLATALGREVLAWRRIVAERVTRRAAVLSGAVGIEPVPLLDIPVQVLIHLRLILRLAAIYGAPLNDRYSRELLATMVGGIALRYVGQQLAKLIPFVGWAASGVLAASGTWALGEVALRYFENGRRLPDARRVLKRKRKT